MSARYVVATLQTRDALGRYGPGRQIGFRPARLARLLWAAL